MQNRLSSFIAQCKKSVPSVVLVAGEEALFVQEALDAVRAAAKAQGCSERIALTVEPGFKWGMVASEMASLSLFASQRLIEVQMPRGPNGHKKAAADDDAKPEASGGASEDGLKLLPELIAKASRDTTLLLVTGELDKRAREAAWVHAVDQAGLAFYALPIKPEDYSAWITERASQAGLQLDADAVAVLAERTEGNVLACAQDIAKLSLLYPQQTVGAEALLAAVADSSRFEAFDLVEKLLLGDTESALHALQRLRSEGTSVLELVGALSYTMRNWATAGAVYARTRDVNAGLAAAKLFGVRARPYETALKRRGFSPSIALALLARVDRAAKSGKEARAWEELLTLTLTATGAAPQTAQTA